jgi:hypothetical protein
VGPVTTVGVASTVKTLSERQRLSPLGQKFTFLRQRAPKLCGADAPTVEKRDIGRRAVWKPGDWQKSSRQKDVEQALDLRIGVRIRASQPFILPMPHDFVIL